MPGCSTIPPPSTDREDRLAAVAGELSATLVDDATREALLRQLGDGGRAVSLGELAMLDGSALSLHLGVDPALASGLTLRAPEGRPGSTERPLVTWIPESAEPATLTYYGDGKVDSVLNAEATPDRPVLLVEVASALDRDTEGYASAEYRMLSTASMKGVRLRRIKIQHDSEVGPFNDPEIYMTCAFPNGDSVKIYLPNVDEEDHWYVRDKLIVNWYLTYGNPMRCAFFEEDGGSFGTITVTAGATLGGVTGQFQYVFPIKNDDDDMGRTIINWDDPNCTTYTTGDVDFRLCW
jgi:hypothetical protein